MRTSLLEYCKLDTLAMVKIFEVLKSLWLQFVIFLNKNIF
jgi:hypothetical protein